MSSTSSINHNQEQPEQQMRGWIPNFCEKTFFNKCTLHADLQENHLNRYCINCEALLCKNCIESHGHHSLLKIYRQAYKDAVIKSDMERHIDCSKIQEYRNNGKKVIMLRQLPLNGAGEAKMTQACHVCKRISQDKAYSFCSIACQVKETGTGETGTGETGTGETGTGFRKKSRKGTPHRSPLE